MIKVNLEFIMIKKLMKNDDFIIEAEVYNDSYELDNSNDIKLLITNKKNEEFMFLFDKFDNKYSLNIGVLSEESMILMLLLILKIISKKDR